MRRRRYGGRRVTRRVFGRSRRRSGVRRIGYRM